MTALPYPVPSSGAATAKMRGNSRRDSHPERLLRSLLHREGYRFRKDLRLDVGGVRIRADIVFFCRKVAIFLDGCFWHGCPSHGRVPKPNSDYWQPKLARNLLRDQRNTTTLLSQGWTVVRVWEHQPIQESLQVVQQALRRRLSDD